jgi:hypothetical protein
LIIVAGASADERARFVLVVSLAAEKRLFLNVRWERLLVSPFGKKPCDINERLSSERLPLFLSLQRVRLAIRH